ncbi:hypothetical protein ACFFWC_11955 [Plantactinospora siamensis]|uniref:Apea-like HEPN domain-containing protein n=1 Tax=Plantactinospora siamensis TaxID=555372 RepID=A0ABV6P322_9ACTN
MVAGHGQDSVPDGPVREKRFGQVARAVRENLSVGVDLVLVHNERVVRGRQPRAALNRSIVVTAVGAWDRFIADTRSAFLADPADDSWGDGSEDSKTGHLYAFESQRVLMEARACERSFLDELRVSAATSWSGVRMQSMEDLVGVAPGRLSGLTFAQHLNQWITLRNALAHGSLRRLLARVDDPTRWTDSRIGDPYASVIYGRYRLWRSDAEGNSNAPEEQRMVGATIQSGCARSCLALIVQLVDWLIVEVGSSFQRHWDVEELRLPAAWFQRGLPGSFRGADEDDYAHWTLWGGPQLLRRW